jgi:cation diffusion facilitator family transporter
MAPSARTLNAENMRAEKRAVARQSVAAAVAITVLKTVVGVSTGSLGILSEAAHSALDLLAAVITMFSVRVSDLPADAEHPYGHGKFENFSAFIETGLLLLTCVWIIYEAFRRLVLQKGPEVEASVAAFAVMLISIAIDWWRSRALKRIADKYDSQALAADALHFSTDIWSSAVVIVGLAALEVGRLAQVRWLRYADPVSALFVAGVVIFVSSRLARLTIDALLDAAPAGVRGQIADAVAAIAGVLEIDRIRIRRAGNHYFVDLRIGLDRTVTFQRSEQLADDARLAVRRVLPDADVIVHTVARSTGRENLFDRIRGVATSNNFYVHDISVQDFGRDSLHVEQSLELDENLSLKEAHTRATQLEAEIRAEIPEIRSILTHIESEPATIEEADSVARDLSLERRLLAIAREFYPEVLDLHDVRVKHIEGRLNASCHVTMKDDLPLSRVHMLSTALEGRFIQAEPALFHVLVHPEPQTENRVGFDISDLKRSAEERASREK